MNRKKGSVPLTEYQLSGKLPVEASEVERVCAQTLSETKDKINELIARAEGKRTFENTVAALDGILADLGDAGSMAYLLGEVHPDSKVRDQSEKCVLDLEKFSNELMLRRDFYEAVKGTPVERLTGEDKVYYDDVILSFKRSGVHLPEETRNKLQAIKDELSELEIQFNRNIAMDNRTVSIKKEQLEGLPERNLKALVEKDGMVTVGLDYPTIQAVSTYVKSEETRKEVLKAFLNRAYPKNIEVLEELVTKRHRMAKLLGYANYAQYQLEDLMAKNTQTVHKFLSDLRARARSKGTVDKAAMDTIKRRMTGDRKAETMPWDKAFYRNIIKEEKYKLNEEEVSEYFSAEATVSGLFKVTETLFGVEIREISAPWKWHEDVKFYEVISSDEKKLVGRFYTDLYPRENKYNHAAKFGLISARRLSNGTYRTPTVAIVANFPKPTVDAPALLKHSDVETFFHEFGHCLHALLTEAKYASASGTSVSRDFVEAPSQMFENWVWEEKSLALFAKHYKTGEVLPKRLLDAMLKAKYLNSGIDTQQQIYYSDISLHLYELGESVQLDSLVRELSQKDTLFPYFEDTHFHASFGHLSGYGAGYYGYNWSKVYAEDMFTRFRDKNLLSRKIGMEYRKKILSRGSGRDEMESVVDFLGRQPNSKAFFESLGFEVTD